MQLYIFLCSLHFMLSFVLHPLWSGTRGSIRVKILKLGFSHVLNPENAANTRVLSALNMSCGRSLICSGFKEEVQHQKFMTAFFQKHHLPTGCVWYCSLALFTLMKLNCNTRHNLGSGVVPNLNASELASCIFI